MLARWDHPRGCGEKSSAAAVRASKTGSSPRVRGEGDTGWSTWGGNGIIPAGAGRSCLVSLVAGLRWDHPRGCGEKTDCRLLQDGTRGSSPRVRGEASVAFTKDVLDRIIPAGAGRSLQNGSSSRPPGDHPRGCGEKCVQDTGATAEKGSSPRVRGEDLDGLLGHVDVGIIPAGAGRSRSSRAKATPSRDHPRGCGEKGCQAADCDQAGGSSPRVRGEGEVWRIVGRLRGIIPAGAGRRRGSPRARRPQGDHPRGCGEKLFEVEEVLNRPGSSPRVRGEVQPFSRAIFSRRIIPAGAGRRV